jgi:hypothetical protein
MAKKKFEWAEKNACSEIGAARQREEIAERLLRRPANCALIKECRHREDDVEMSRGPKHGETTMTYTLSRRPNMTSSFR